MSGRMAPLEGGSFKPLEHAILGRIAGFARLLRSHGFAVGLGESADAARLAGQLAAERPAALRSAFKALFCSRASDWKQFDALFDSYWRGLGMKRVMKVTGSAPAGSRPTLAAPLAQGAGHGDPRQLIEEISDLHDGDPQDGGTARSRGASAAELHGATDFRKIADPYELAKAHAAAERLARVMRTRLTRRERARAKGRRIDLRSTIRRNIARGGTLLDLRLRQRKAKPLRLVVLLDASGSMQMYTAVFTRFIHGVLDNFHEAEAFIFHTRLAHVSSAMKEKNAGRAVERLSLMAEGVGGGTRIGECLATFNQWHAKRVLNSRSCVMILSDGYDTGAPEMLARELQRLRRRCRRIVWLNPMMGWEGYRPEAKAMQAAMPYLDLFAPAHNLESLAALEPYLARL
ncbi:MAG: vWA domain-containing protein [Hyphomicrobiales bacterium]